MSEMSEPGDEGVREVVREVVGRLRADDAPATFMQAVGLVNDHLVRCFRYQQLAESPRRSVPKKAVRMRSRVSREPPLNRK